MHYSLRKGDKDVRGRERMQYWRLLDYSSKDPAMNLAIEEAILRCLLEYNSLNTLRFWQNPPSVVIGCFQNPYDVVNITLCKRLGINIIRRISGGGAVYHDYGNLNYSVFVHTSSLKDLMKDQIVDVEKSYSLLCGGVVEGLKVLGVKAYNQGGNIMINGRKVSGSAQHRLYDVILHHGTLMVDVNLDMLKQTLRISSLERALINLYDVLPNKIPLSEIKRVIKAGFEKIFNMEFKEGALTPEEKHIAKRLWKAKYSKISWNMTKPAYSLHPLL
jgi:lipoate-protein ligase A